MSCTKLYLGHSKCSSDIFSLNYKTCIVSYFNTSGTTHDKDKHDLALVKEECRVIYKHKNQCPMGDPFVKTRIILNLFFVFWKMPTNFALHTSISYLLTTSKCTLWKSLYRMLYNLTTIFQLIEKYHPNMTH